MVTIYKFVCVALVIAGSFASTVAFGASGALDKRRGDVIMPKIELDPTQSIPGDLSNPEGFQKYLDEIDSSILPKIRKESPENARQLSSVGVVPTITPNELSRFTEDTARMLFERGGYSEEDQKQVYKFIDMNKEESPYEKLHLVVFLSSSMPAATIRNYVDILGNVDGVVFALRGFIGNDPAKIMPTVKWLKGFKCNGDSEGAVCVKSPMDINPMLFRWLKVTQVPAIAYVVTPNQLESCDSDTVIEDDKFLLFYGDVSPAYILEQFRKARPSDAKLASLATALQGISWEMDKPKRTESPAANEEPNTVTPQDSHLPDGSNS